MLIEIDKIKVTDRIRKDFGNLQELADDIKENGLINPPVVTPEYQLIAGERRLRAMKELGYKQIEVRVMTVQDALHQLKLEISENENRKDFTFSEKMIWAEQLKEEYSKIAKENMLKGITLDQNLSKVDSNKQVAQDLEMSKETFRQAEYIYQNADEDMIKELDDKKLSINKAYTTLKERNQQLENQVNQLKNQPPKIVEKEKIIDKTDYGLSSKNKQLQNEIDKITREKQRLENINEGLNKSKQLADELNKKYEKQVDEYMRVKSKILDLSLDPNGEYNMYTVMTELEQFTKDIDDLLLNKLAPVKYKKSMQVVKNSDLKNNFANIIKNVNEWCLTMASYIGVDLNNNFNDFIEIESEEI